LKNYLERVRTHSHAVFGGLILWRLLSYFRLASELGILVYDLSQDTSVDCAFCSVYKATEPN